MKGGQPEAEALESSNVMLYLFDVDGTLRKALLAPRLGSLSTWDQRILPGRLDRLRALRQAGHRLGAASNQGIVAMGLISERQARRIMDETNRRLENVLEWIRICPHHPRGLRADYRVNCLCRKPRPGMLHEALKKFGLEPGDAMYVGDRESDRAAAVAAGFQFQPSEQFFR